MWHKPPLLLLLNVMTTKKLIELLLLLTIFLRLTAVGVIVWQNLPRNVAGLLQDGLPCLQSMSMMLLRLTELVLLKTIWWSLILPLQRWQRKLRRW
jgi:hypothetical protein